MSNDSWRRYAEVYAETGSLRMTAKTLGVNESTVRRSLKRAAERGDYPGYGNDSGNGMVPPGHSIVKNTVHYKNGELVQQWARIVPSMEDIEGWVDDLCERVSGKGRIIKPRSGKLEASLNELVIGDPHAGMYAWAAETGTDYDVDIFRDVHVGAVTKSIERLGPTEDAVLCVLGDLFHADNMKTTERSGNVLDVDGRIDRVMDVVEKALVECIELMAAN
ncbi:MAG: hypothetical protein MJH10_18890, partial [Epibacterium sp.]|nr:hypothetical protein [Epibacterium sp.]NQX75552.1 hypothetical protein [Epibacterium sp.]